jgi:hypothetical protein
MITWRLYDESGECAHGIAWSVAQACRVAADWCEIKSGGVIHATITTEGQEYSPDEDADG